MMLKKIGLLIGMLLVLVGGLPVQAAGAPWWVWLYTDSGVMAQVDSSGQLLQQFFLPADPGSTFSRSVAMSSDGRYVGYSVTSGGLPSVRIYDLGTGAVIHTYGLPPNSVTSLDYAASSLNFSPGNTSFAFGYVKDYDFYSIVVIDMLSGEAPTLIDDNIQAGLGGSLNSLVMIPVVQNHTADLVQFTAVPYGTGGASQYPCVEWRISTGYLGFCNSYIQMNADTYANTGEVVMALADLSFPGAENPEGMGYLQNTIKAFTPATNELFTVTTLTDLILARFIQDGERVAAVTSNSSYNYVFNIMERSGAISASVMGSYSGPITSMAGTLNGFVFTTSDSMGGGGGTTLTFVETRFNVPPYVANIWNSGMGADLRIVWTSDLRPAAIPAFNGWGRVNGAVMVAPVSAESAPLAAGTLMVGGQARVYTTEGDMLNVRTGPGRNFQRLGTVGNGAIVTILEGSVTADGFNWWRIRLPNAQEGWVVDFADGVPTLIAQ